MSEEPIAHLVVEQVGRGVRAHATGIGAAIGFANAFVILRRHQRGHALAIAHHQKRDFFALQQLFEDHLRAGFAQHFSGEHVAGNLRGFVLGLRDNHTFACCQAIGLDH